MSSLPTIHEGDLVAYMAPTEAALKGCFRSVFDMAVQRVAAAGQRIDRETGEVVDRRFYLAFGEATEDKTLRQLRFYFGPVLRQIAEQAPGGWTAEAWHEAMKRTELGYEVIKVQVAGRTKPTIYRRLRSVKDLTVKQMSEYLDRVIATATTALGVAFQFDEAEREAVRYRRPARKAKAPEAVEA